MFSLAYNLPKTMSNFCLSKLRWKTSIKTMCIFRPNNYIQKVRGNDVCFSTIGITPIKVRGNNVDFLTIKTTSRKYAEMTQKFVEIWSSMYRRNIHVEWTWIWRGVPVGTFLQPTFSEKLLFDNYGFFPQLHFLITR